MLLHPGFRALVAAFAVGPWFALAAAGCASSENAASADQNLSPNMAAGGAAGEATAANQPGPTPAVPSSAGGTGGAGQATAGDSPSVPPADAGSQPAAEADAGASEPPLGTPYVYISGYNDSITRFRLDPQTGMLSDRQTTTPGVPSPSYLAIAPNKQHLYALNEAGGQNSLVLSFAIDTANGSLSKVNETAAFGDGPAHLSVHPSGELVLVSHYASGDIVSLRIADGAASGPAADSENPGQDTSHQIVSDSAGRYVFVPHVRLNTVLQFQFDSTTGQFTDNGRLMGMPDGAGPRHIAFHPSEKWAYTINETAITVSAMNYDAMTGKLSDPQTVDSLPPGANREGTGAHIVVHPSGQFVYASNRGHNSITLFDVDPATGQASYAANETGDGMINTPRDFDVDETGRVLIVANQSSASALAFQIDAADGSLQLTQSVEVPPNPSFVGIVYLP